MAPRNWIGRVILLAALGLGGCQTPRPASAPVAESGFTLADGVGFMVFNAPINDRTRDLFIQDLEAMRRGGAKEIRIGFNSGGGSIDAARGMVEYMDRERVQDGMVFNAYNLGVVASAATYVFLNAQTRSTVANGAFLFHAATATSTGGLTAESLRDAANKLDDYERTMRRTLARRTHLTDAEATTYLRRTVILNAEDARRDGVVDTIGGFSLPPNLRGFVIGAPRTAPARPAATPATTQPGG